MPLVFRGRRLYVEVLPHEARYTLDPGDAPLEIVHWGERVTVDPGRGPADPAGPGAAPAPPAARSRPAPAGRAVVRRTRPGARIHSHDVTSGRDSAGPEARPATIDADLLGLVADVAALDAVALVVRDATGAALRASWPEDHGGLDCRRSTTLRTSFAASAGRPAPS